MPLLMRIQRPPQFNGKFIALVILLLIVVMAVFSRCTSCCDKKHLDSAEQAKIAREIDSIRIRNSLIDAELQAFKKSRAVRETVYIHVANTFKNEIKKINSFNDSTRRLWNDSFLRANNIIK